MKKKGISIIFVLILFLICFAGASNTDNIENISVENMLKFPYESVNMEISGKSGEGVDDNTSTMRRATQEEIEKFEMNSNHAVPEHMEINDKTTYKEKNK